MLIQKDLKKIYNQLFKDDVFQISFFGSEITIRVFDSASKLALSTPVYYGGNFIPKSVRHGVMHKFPFKDDIRTHLNIDEDQFQINLNYLGSIEPLDQQEFFAILEAFSEIAERWRAYLDEHDKNDLIYIRVKP